MNIDKSHTQAGRRQPTNKSVWGECDQCVVCYDCAMSIVHCWNATQYYSAETVLPPDQHHCSDEAKWRLEGSTLNTDIKLRNMHKRGKQSRTFFSKIHNRPKITVTNTGNIIKFSASLHNNLYHLSASKNGWPWNLGLGSLKMARFDRPYMTSY